MPKLLLRAEMRDYIRRSMGKVPYQDVPAPIGPGPIGEPAPSQPNPVNGRLNDQIGMTVAQINLQAGTFYDDPVPRQYPFTAQAGNGPYAIPFANQDIDIVRTAWIVDTGGNYYDLDATSRYDLQRDN